MIRFWKSQKWQDLVLAIGSGVLLASLQPSIFGDQKPAALTSLVTALALASFLSVYVSYKLWLAFATTALTSLSWFVLFAQVAL